MNRIYVIAGGTFVDVAPHLSLSARAFGRVGRQVAELLPDALADAGKDLDVHLLLTRMALGGTDRPKVDTPLLETAGVRDIVTNEDLGRVIDHLISLPSTKGIVMAAAVTDFVPETLSSDEAPASFGSKTQARLDSSQSHTLTLNPADKLLGRIREHRKDIFLVGFKTTAGADPKEQYTKGLLQMKSSHVNLVLANDVFTRNNMIITPERARYHETTNRDEAIRGLCEMMALRIGLMFTRSTVVEGPSVAWQDDRIPASLRSVVDHCIAQGAYKPFRGSTVGHFAARGPDDTILTSKRWTNFNELEQVGLVEIEAIGDDQVIAHGAKPSVGGQSQRMIFAEHPDVDCIVHFHCPPRPGSDIPIRSQRPYECGSHECGANTSAGLESFEGIKAVMLDQHGPNIVFSADVDPQRVIAFIDANFDLQASTDGFRSEVPGEAYLGV